MNKSHIREKVIVSLTSFPAAIPYAVQAIRSVLNGSVLPDKVVLYLDTQKFPDGILPTELEGLKKEYPIFEVRFDDAEIRSYKKLIPALRDFPEDVIVTVDDDICYHKNLLRDLIRVHKRLPNAIIAHRVRRIEPDKPYHKWHKYKWFNFLFKKIHANYKNLQTGVGSVLYPPHSLKPEMLDEKLFTQIAPTMDDIWFWAAAVANDTPVVPVPFGYNKPVELAKPRDISLQKTNYRSGVDRNREAFLRILDTYPSIREKIEK